MPLAKYLNYGQMIDYTPDADVAVGAVVVAGDLIGVAVHPLFAGRLGALAIKGVCDVAKGAGAISGGTKLYWDATAGVATTSAASGANKFLGKAVFAGAASGDTIVRVILIP
jgi:predicted RecA/RadA family phage recombinase